MKKIFFRIFFLIAVIALICKLWINYSCSFRIDKIQPDRVLQNPELNISDSFNSDAILNQNFYLLDKGRHTFVFSSEDDKYVIKFFRFHRYSMPFFFKIFKSYPFIKNYYEKLDKELNISYLETMDSYKLTYENLKDETATIYVHLARNNILNKKIKIFDKFLIKHEIDLDKYGFVLQHKAKSFSKEFLKVKEDKLAIENLLASFFENLSLIYKKNIINNDRHILNNLGIIDNRVVEIDTGRFSMNLDMSKKEILEKEVYHYTVYLRKWLSKNIPQALPVLDSHLVKFVDCISNEKNTF